MSYFGAFSIYQPPHRQFVGPWALLWGPPSAAHASPATTCQGTKKQREAASVGLCRSEDKEMSRFGGVYHPCLTTAFVMKHDLGEAIRKQSDFAPCCWTQTHLLEKKRLWTCAAKSPTIHNDDAPHVNLDLKKTPNLAIGYEQFHETLNLGHEKIIQNTARTSSRVIGRRCLQCVRLQGALWYKLLLEDLAHAGDPPILSWLHLRKRGQNQNKPFLGGAFNGFGKD